VLAAMSWKSRTDRLGGRQVSGVISTVRSVVGIARDRNLTGLAAAIAYYAFVSILPLVLLAVAVASFVGGQALVDRVVAVFNRQLSAAGQQSVARALTDQTGREAASVVGVLALLWSSLKVFRGLDLAFDELYTDETEASILDQVRDALIVVAGIGFAVALVVAVSVVLSSLQLRIPFAGVIATVVLVAVLVLAFLPIYYVLPPVEVSVREVLPGTVVAAVGWVLLQGGFRIYVTSADRYGAYGLVGAALLFVTLLYFASIVVLLGTAVNAARWGAPVDPS